MVFAQVSGDVEKTITGGTLKVATAISVRNLRKVYPGQPPVVALADASIDIKDNEFFTLLGPSGCGKTTLLRMIAGF